MYEYLLTVSQLNQYVGELLAADPLLHGLRVEGEISGFKRHTSGHLYFSLKDETALVRCVMFRTQAQQLDFRPADGMRVVLTGYASLYARDGSFQLYALSLDRVGEGELYRRFLALKDKLEREGYFDPAHKRELPYLPARVGVVTSGTGAAVQDILQIIGRRFPNMPVVLAPVRVQGAGAAEEIARAIAKLNEKDACDVMIVGRGGGSIEDLWAFNEPVVAQAIYDSRIPVVSAVGHETDVTIADFVADLRAPTPSAAAELAVPEEDACRELIETQEARLRRALVGTLETQRSHVRLLAASHAFRAPRERVMEARLTLDRSAERMRELLRERMRAERGGVQTAAERLRALSPLAVLTRGYAVVRGERGETYMRAEQLHAGQRVSIMLQDGSALSEILRVERKKPKKREKQDEKGTEV